MSAVTSTPFGTTAAVVSRTGRSHSGAAAAEGVSVSSSSSWCGPFAVAREMIAQREEAKRLREKELEEEEQEANRTNHPLDALVKQVELEQHKKVHPSLQWKSKMSSSSSSSGSVVEGQISSSNKKQQQQWSESIYAKRQKRVDASVKASRLRVPTLYELAVRFVVDHFDDVESLGEVDHDIRSAIARELVARQKLDPLALDALLEPDLEALELVDCSQIPQDVMLKALEKLKSSLRYLYLDMCGRCMGPKVVEALVKNGNHLAALSIGGAYLLKDADAARLIGASQDVTSLEFKACPLLGSEFCRALVTPRTGTHASSLVELSLSDLPLDESHLEILASSSDPDNSNNPLRSLKSLSLRRFDAMTDDLAARILEHASNLDLHHLDLSHNYYLTDDTLAAIRKHAGSSIRSLSLSGLKRLTSQGLEALFMPVPGGVLRETPPVLHSLELANLHHQAVTDEVIQLVCQASSSSSTSTSYSQQRYYRDGGKHHQQQGLGLVRLNVQGSSALTYASCEHLVSTSSRTLEELNLSFCTQVSDQGLGYLVQHCRSLQKLDIWGCAQVTDVFLDGHDRLLDASLEISGAWIKKSSTEIT
jgi:DNA repair protein RAD7